MFIRSRLVRFKRRSRPSGGRIAGVTALRGVPTAALAIALLAVPALAQAVTEPGRITVMGEGRVAAAPDMATITLTVSRDAPSAGEALRAASQAMGEVLAAMGEEGIAERDLRTTEVSLFPIYAREETGPGRDRPSIAGYTARNGLDVRVRDLSRLGAVIDRAVTMGANEGGGLVFGNADGDELSNEARAAAVRDARTRADAMAEAAGVQLGRLVSLREAGGGAPPPVFETRMAVAEAAPVPIAGGESETVARVEAVFEIGPTE